jgi:hypothetical protein
VQRPVTSKQLPPPGNFIAEETASIAWHCRLVARGFGEMQARKLRVRLSQGMVGRLWTFYRVRKCLMCGRGAPTRRLSFSAYLSHEALSALITALGGDRADGGLQHLSDLANSALEF